MTTDPQTDRLDELRAEYANTGMVMYDGAVWLISQVVVLRERLAAAAAVLVAAPPTTGQTSELAEDLRYVLGHGEPGHDHEQPGVWDTSGEPCTHCARLAVAQQNLAAYDAGAVLPAPADRAATLREAADAVDELCEKTDANVYRAAVRAITAPAVSSRPGTEQEA
ncbi:MAG TPA: hypothetical protein VLK35_17490 [Methylomirabilota bacterium]|nr:hypothetical protein [Methylomirabilota bacterium]